MNPFFKLFFSFFLINITIHLNAQNLPSAFHLSDDGHRLISGGLVSDGIYDEAEIQIVELWFDQSNWWNQLSDNYDDGIDIPALLIVNGDSLVDPVGVRFKGATSYFMNNNEKKSFNISLDYDDSNQKVDGYKTFNLNCGYLDHSSIRENLYLHLIRKHIPAAKGNFVQLYLNGEYWGPYSNIQQLNSKFIEEWYPSSDGSRWRAIDPDFSPGGGGPGGPGGNPFGTGTSSLNYLGNDTTDYAEAYTLKSTSKENPWEDLINTTDILENTPLDQLEDAIKEVLDLDRTLWFLASEIMYTDDDSYIWKGGMDYYLYWDPETGRMTPLEYDGNTCIDLDHMNWGPFYHSNDEDYPLLNRLLAVNSIRQRYLAHVRTMLEEVMIQSDVEEKINAYTDLIGELVENDPKAIYSYNQFLNGIDDVKSFIEQRRDFYWNNGQVNQEALELSNAQWSVNNETWALPLPGEEINITVNVTGTPSVGEVNLFYGTNIIGNFSKTQMFDDGAHNDGSAGDGIYGVSLNDFNNGTYVRFYIEGIADNNAETRTYHPRGAEHDVYFFRVGITAYIESDIVINEIMASNDVTMADQDGEFDDWIELYNTGNETIDISGWHLTDDETILDKWTFPAGTIINSNDYLIIWADDDEQDGMHANFKLSAGGETIWFTNDNLEIVEEIIFGEQETDKGFARSPNGTGDFVIKDPTFNANNDNPLSTNDLSNAQNDFELFPNPAKNNINIIHDSSKKEELTVFNAIGQIVLTQYIQNQSIIDIQEWCSGIYYIRIGTTTEKLIKI